MSQTGTPVTDVPATTPDGKPVTIFDTTLRDGEQAPGISLDVGEKLEIAEQLARLRVDVIEAGFPITSQGDFDGVKAIADTVGTHRYADGGAAPVIAALARCHPDDIRKAADALKGADASRIHVFLSTSEIHRNVMLKGASEDQIIEQSVEAVKQALSYTDNVEFSPQDATRTNPDFLLRIVDAVVEAGATTVNIPDTVGYALPHDFGALIGDIVRRVGDDAAISVHCHNDLGLAVANSVEAVRNGARQVEVAVNGLGERAGNCSMEEVVMALNTRRDLINKSLGINTREIARTSRMVAQLTGYPIQFNKAVVGRNAFAHESGIHQHGVIQDRLTYEIMNAEDLGYTGAQIVLGKHSGRHAFAQALEEMGYTLEKEEIGRAFDRFKELADRKSDISDADLEAILADELYSAAEDAYELVWTQVSGGTTTAPTATVRVKHMDDGREVTEAAVGDGMIDAVCGAIRRACGVDGRLVTYNVAAVTPGVDALGDVTCQVEVDGRRYTGRGVSTDVVEASARAFVNGLNKAFRLAGNPKAQTGAP
ncbi:2-isopropylmalate synthase [Euzebya rosea]|uniref:2-isopropylmalate synthase n=1 Tax=Euzebya rosea TaxID=2052804 RepID=UPI000D3E900A|nr:2-isopropylmalate synthase [Euzebya rosea]